MRRRLAATRAILGQLEAVRRIATILPGDVVTFLALRARQSDLGANVLRLACHDLSFTGGSEIIAGDREVTVAGAGLEPATSRL